MIQFTKSQRYLLSILSGILMVISFPFTGSLTFLAFFSWVPLLLIEDAIYSNRYRSGKIIIHAYITFFIYNVGTTWWIWNASEGGAMLAFLLNSLLMAITFWGYHKLKRALGKSVDLLALLLVWCGFEYIHFNWELSWPWLTFGNVFSIRPSWVQWYSITGVLGGSIWILSVNFLIKKILVTILINRKSFLQSRKQLLITATILFLPLIISYFQYIRYEEKGKPVEVVVVQPNIDPYTEKFFAPMEEQIDKITRLADQQVRPETDFVIAPETALSLTFPEERVNNLQFIQSLKEIRQNWGKAAFVTGASTTRYFPYKHSRASRKIPGDGGYYESYNSTMLLDNHNQPSFVHKSKLVLGVEMIPFSDWFPGLEELSIQNGGASGTLGIEKEATIMKTDNYRFAPSVCYESIYGEFVSQQFKKGAEMLFVITNDGWWKDTPGYKQHASFSRLRAIENRTYVARSANTGTSCIINQRGDILQQTGWWVPAVIRDTILAKNSGTFYTINGDILGKTSVLGMLFLLILSFFQKGKNRPSV